MKKVVTLCVVSILGLAVVGHAQEGLRIGAHGAYSTGGDVENSDFGYGAQLEIPLSPTASLELSGTRFTDDYSEDDLKLEQTLNTIGASIILRMPIDEALGLYVLGGVNYNIVDFDVALPPGLEWMRIEVDIDDEFGFHVGGGLSLALSPNLSLFGEYRYTFLDLKGTISAALFGLSEEFKGDYDFGLVKAGLNLHF